MKRANPYPSKQKTKKQKTQGDAVKALERKVNALSRAVELKQIETAETQNFLANSIAGWNYVVGLSDILQGTGEQERIGSEITVKQIEVVCRIQVPDDTLLPFGIRYLIFKDSQHSQSATLAGSTPFGSTTSPLETMVTGVEYVSAMLRKWDMRSRYHFYRDQTDIVQPECVYSFNTSTGLTTRVIPRIIIKKFVVNIPNVKVYYTGPEKANNTVSRNMFQLGVYMDFGGSVPPVMSCSTRMIFTD